MHASATPEAALRVVGRYSVFRELASGGMATVHLGHMAGSAGFSRIVAIKRMKPEIARQADYAAMFRDEAMIAARVQHPNVVTTIDVVSEDDELFIVMEYVRGLALKQLMQITFDRDERVPVDIALSVIGGALEGLHAAHNARGDGDQLLDLVHRDVSPHNILVGRDGVAKIVDFGVAKATSRMHQTGANQVKGKLTYMAPERITSKEIDLRVDIFSAGVVLWEVLAGRKRYEGDSVQEIAAKLLTTDAPSLAGERSDVPAALDAVISRATARSPDERYATAEAMLADLERIGNFATKRAVSAWVEETGRDLLREHEELTRSLRAQLSEDRDAPDSAFGRDGPPPNSGITLVHEPTFDPEPEQPLKTEATRIIPELASEPASLPLPPAPVPRPLVATVQMRAVDPLRIEVPTQVMHAIPHAPRVPVTPPTSIDGDEDLETRLIRAAPAASDEDLETRLIRAAPTASDEDLETRLIRTAPTTQRGRELETRVSRRPTAAPARSPATVLGVSLISLLLVIVVTVLGLRAC